MSSCSLYPRSHSIRDFITTFRAEQFDRDYRRAVWERLRAEGTLALSFGEDVEAE